MTLVLNGDLVERALAAYFRHTAAPIDQPCSGGVKIHEVQGQRYVTVQNSYRLLACYRVRNDGRLKRLSRVPRELQD